MNWKNLFSTGLRGPIFKKLLYGVVMILSVSMGFSMVQAQPELSPFPNPTNVVASDGTDTTVDIGWDTICNAYIDHYEIHYTFNLSSGIWALAGEVPATSCGIRFHFYHEPDWAYRVHYYRVVSCPEPGYACALDEPYETDTGYSMLIPPPVSASDGAYTDKVRVTFVEDLKAVYYQAWRATDPGGPYALLGNTPNYTEIYDDTTASSGVTYYYKGKSCNTYGCSDLSYFWDYGMASSEPPAVQASDGEFWYVYLVWDPMPGAHTYRVYRATTPTPPPPANYYQKDIYDDGTTNPQDWIDYGADPYTTYYYWVVSCIEPTCGPLDEYDSGWRKYRPPYNVSASDGTHTDRVALSWGSDDTVDFYKVYRAESVAGEKSQLGVPTGMSFDDVTAVPGITYYYWITACDSSFCSDFSGNNTGWKAWVVPTNIQATDGTSTALTTITWDSVPGATSYEVYRCTGTGTGSCGASIGNPGIPSFGDGLGSPGVDYYYRVKACAGASNCSDFSACDVGWRMPLTPVNLQASDGAYTDKIQITWNPVSGVSSYKLYRYIADSGTPNLIASPGTTTYNDTAPSPGRTYWYWVKACGSDHCSALSADDDGWRSIIAPGNVQASDGIYTDKVVITWDAVGAAASYRVNRADTEMGTKTQIGSPSGESFDDTTALPGKTYFYWISSCAWGKCGDFSSYDTGWRFGYLIHLPLIMR